MSWRFPRFRLRDGNALSTDDTNDSFLESADEMSGRLNEHNWASGAIPTQADVQQDAAFVWHQVAVAADLFDSAGAGQVNWFEVEVNSGWVRLGGMVLTITGPSALYWLHASSMYRKDLVHATGLPFMRWAIRVDGQIVPESVVGGLEDDFLPLNWNGYRPVGGMSPIETNLLIPATAGQHIIEFCVRLDSVASLLDHLEFISRELICLEMRR